jgi:membrane metallo-endopeptidase-like protein 1
MDQETRVKAKEKAEVIDNMIGFPDYILDPEQLDNEYKSLEIQNDTYFDNTLRINVYYYKKTLEKLDKPVNRTKWEMGPATVNAYYSPNKNQVAFPAGILQTPFFNAKYPKSFNFGAIGAVMGHELTHAFDDQGSMYDKDGNLKRWWKNETISKFKEATKCIENQYANCSINGKHLNGIQTLGELFLWAIKFDVILPSVF